MTAAPRRLTMYSKPGCHLCDDMKQVIESVATRVALTLDVVDISADQTLMDRYGLEIPVLLIEGKKAAKYRVTERELEHRLRRSR
jgi:hypothetical protein